MSGSPQRKKGEKKGSLDRVGYFAANQKKAPHNRDDDEGRGKEGKDSIPFFTPKKRMARDVAHGFDQHRIIIDKQSRRGAAPERKKRKKKKGGRTAVDE